MDVDRILKEKILNLKKGIEIVGGNYLLEDSIENIIAKAFVLNNGKIIINDVEYSSEQVFKEKLEYEKYLLLNKKKVIEKVAYKIKQYDTKLETLMRRYNNTTSIEEYNEIINHILKEYEFDINNFILNKVVEIDSEANYYGDYLTEKRDGFVKGIFFKLFNK